MRRSGNINRTGHSLFSAENEDPRFDYATILPNRESRVGGGDNPRINGAALLSRESRVLSQPRLMRRD